MSHLVSRSLLVLGLGFTLSVTAVAQDSLGDAARQARKNKPPEPTTKVITNEDLGESAPVRTEGDSKDADSAKANADSGKNDTSAKKSEKSETLSADDQAKLDKEWQEKIAAQKDQISLLERELDVLQHENQLRASNYYGDAGTRLRDPQKYADDDRKSREKIDEKQKAIDEAKSKLEQMKDDARKAGASSGAIS
jgi:hypothetical protein